MSRDYIPPSRRKPNARNTRVKPSRKSIPGWLWMAGGILIGVLVTGIINLRDDEPASAQAVEEQKESAEQPREKGEPTHKPRFDFYTLLKESEVIVPDENGNFPTAKPLVIAEPDKKEAGKDEEHPEEKAAAVKDNRVAEATLDATLASMEAEMATEEQEKKAVAPETASVTPAPAPLPEATPEPAKPQPVPATPSEVYVLQAGSFKNAADADSVRASLLLLNMHANIERVSTGPNETWHRVLVGPFTNTSDLASARALLSQNGIDSIQVKRKQ